MQESERQSKPYELTDRDRELVLEQCENQRATLPEQIEAFTEAYREARDLFANSVRVKEMSAQEWEAQVVMWAAMIEPDENVGGYRRKPAIFDNGNEATAHQLLSEQMPKFFEKLWVESVRSPDTMPLTAEQVYKIFETHHPFGDGNGRVGHLLWAGLEQMRTGEWPNKLPPDVFNEDTYE